MKKSILILISLLVLQSFSLSFAQNSNNNFENVYDNTNLLTENQYSQLSKILSTYSDKNKDIKLDKKAIIELAKSNGLGDIEPLLFTEEELNLLYNDSEYTRSTLNDSLQVAQFDIDIVQYFLSPIVDIPLQFGIYMGMKNIDLVDVHDLYSGTAMGYCEASPGSNVFITRVNHTFYETNIHPGITASDLVYMGLLCPGKAYFYVHMVCTDDGVSTTPFYKGAYNRMY